MHKKTPCWRVQGVFSEGAVLGKEITSAQETSSTSYHELTGFQEQCSNGGMTNFLEETKQAINAVDKRPVFIGSLNGEYGFTLWSDFEKLADFEYDSGYGGQHIAQDLVVIFADGSWLTRGEYDGSEWWEYNAPPAIPKTFKQITKLQSDDSWYSLSDLQNSKTYED